MDSNLLVRIHTISVILFLFTYLVKTILLYASPAMLRKYSAATKVPEMIISAVFLITGIWLFVIIGGIKTNQIIKLVLVFISIPLAIIGFKREKRGLALLALLLIIGAYGSAEMGKGKPYIPAKAIAANGGGSEFANGALVYYSNCAFCHGQDGKKKYRNAPDLTLTGLNEDAIVQMMHEGKGRMPSYTNTLTEEEIKSVAVFVKGLRPVQIAPGE